MRVYAIGDIHGRLDLLDDLLEKIRADHELQEQSHGHADMHIVFLGDLIDRGPDSAGVIDRVMELHKNSPNIRFLMGNHEEVYLEAATGEEKSVRFFNRIGGQETILSYGLPYAQYRNMENADLAEALPGLIPAEHVAFVKTFDDTIVYGDYAFVHAGIRPGVPLEEQTAGDLRWIRGDFLRKDEIHEKMIVHGHTITEDVDECRGRIGIDTGAYDSGILTAIALEGTQRRFLQTGIDAAEAA